MLVPLFQAFNLALSQTSLKSLELGHSKFAPIIEYRLQDYNFYYYLLCRYTLPNLEETEGLLLGHTSMILDIVR